MKIFKKITALAMAAVVVSANIAVTASAATASTYGNSDIVSWGLHVNPAYSYSTMSVGVATYGLGYWACMTTRTGDCPVNNVSITGEYQREVKVYEVGKSKARFFKPYQVTPEPLTYFTVKMNYEGGSVASNNGDIVVGSIWDNYEM